MRRLSFQINNNNLFLNIYNGKMCLFSHSVPFFVLLAFFQFCSSSKLVGRDLTGYDRFRGLDRTNKVDGFRNFGTSAVDLARLYGSSLRMMKVVNVDDYGATGDSSDDTQAFERAWRKACGSKGAVFVVPGNKVYHLKPITFSGPCESPITMKVYGTIKASNVISDYEKNPRHWIQFTNISDFDLLGGGTFNGNGKIWWQKSCKRDPQLPCKEAPTAVTFSDCKNTKVFGLRFKNAQQMHLTFQKCVNILVSNVKVVSPERSPNTDGIHVTGTKNIKIMSSDIRTGDDCVSIVSGSKNVKVTDINCGPGHGISIGSLGKGNSEDYVSDVYVSRIRLSGTTNGVRIKTWQGGSGYAKNIMFQNIMMHNVSNPIIIDQNYCDSTNPCPEQVSSVQVKNVAYKNIWGTSASEEAIKFDCSTSIPCQGIQLENIQIVRHLNENAKALCSNVKLSTSGKVSPSCSSED